MQICTAHLVSVMAGLLLDISWAAQSGGEREQMGESDGDWEGSRETAGQTHPGPCMVWDRTLLRGREGWHGRKQLLMTWEAWHGRFGNPVSDQSSVTQEQGKAKGPSVSPEDMVGRREWFSNCGSLLL